MKIYWYEVYKMPRIDFEWFRSYENGKMYIGFDGGLDPYQLNQCNGVEMGHLTLDEFENKYGTFMNGIG